MPDRRRTRRRLAVILSLAAALAVATGGLFLFRQHQQRADVERSRVDGLAAHADGDHAAAIDRLSRYVAHAPRDAEALLALARSRAEIEQPEKRHLLAAARLYRRAIALDPDHAGARDELLAVVSEIGLLDQTLDLTEPLIAARPHDPEVLGLRLDAMLGLGRFDQLLNETQELLDGLPTDHPAYPPAAERRIVALSAAGRAREAFADAERLLGAYPDAVTPAVLRLETARAVGEDPATLKAWAVERQEASPDDAARAFVRGVAHQYAGERAEAIDWLHRAADLDPAGDRLLTSLSRALASLGRYDAAAGLAMRHHRAFGGDASFAVAAHYLALAPDFDGLMAWTEPVAASPGDYTATPVALRAMAHLAAGDADAAAPLLEALESRAHSPVATAWAAALRARFELRRAGATAIEPLADAVRKAPRLPWPRYWLGEAYASAGETDAAIAAWVDAARLERGWVAPRLALAEALRSRGRWVEAHAEAQRAMLLGPPSLAVVRSLVVSASRVADRAAPADEARLLDLSERLLGAMPDDGGVLAARARLLHALRGGDAAQAFVLELVNDDTSRPAAAWSELLAGDRELGLGLAEPLARRLRGVDERSPTLALAASLALLDDGRAADAVERFAEAMRRAGGDEDPRWLARGAALHDAASDPAALAWWERAVAAAPGDPEVLIAALNAPSTLEDAAFHRAATGRLRELTGDDATHWKLAEARARLRHDASPESWRRAEALLRDVAEAAPTRADALLLQAELHRLRGEPAKRVERLEAALERTGEPEIGLRLVEVLESLGRFGDAAHVLATIDYDAVTGAPRLAERAAAAMLRTGDLTAARTLLERSIAETDALDPGIASLLARLYERRGRADDAEALIERLLDEAAPGASGIAIDFFARRGDLDRARGLLERQNEASGDRVAALLDRAAFEQAYGSVEAAEAMLREATAASPPRADAWRRWVAFRLSVDGVDAAAEALAVARAAAPDAQGLAVADRVAALAIEHEADRPALRPLLRGALEVPEDAGAIARAADAYASSRGRGGTRAERAAAMRAFASSVRSEPVSVAAARLLALAGMRAEAASFAERESRRFPGVELPRLAAVTLAETRAWDRALASAEVWNHRAGSGDPVAIAMIVTARAALGRPSPRLLPRLEAAFAELAASDDPPIDVVTPITEALIVAGREELVREALRPRVGAVGPWWELWLTLAVARVDSVDAAMAWLDAAWAAVDPVDPAAARRYAAALEAMHRRSGRDAIRPRVLEVLEAAHAASPDDAGVLRDLALTLERLGRVDEAILHYENLLAITPDDVVGLNNLALLYARRGASLDRAVTMIARAVDLRPSIAALRDSQGEVLASVGRTDEAVAAHRDAIDLEPDAARWRLRLAQRLLDLGRAAEAERLIAEIEADAIAGRASLPEDLAELLDELVARIETPAATAGE